MTSATTFVRAEAFADSGAPQSRWHALHQAYAARSGFTIGAWNNPDQICTKAVTGEPRACIFFPGTPAPGLTLQRLINAVSPDDPAKGPSQTTIYVVPVSWKVARLVWSYASTSDLSFYNVNNAEVSAPPYPAASKAHTHQGTTYTPYPDPSTPPSTAGPFAAQKLSSKASLWNAMCQINLNGAAKDQSLLREAFSTLLSAVEAMRSVDGRYTVPIWDTPGFDPRSDSPFTTSMTEAEVRSRPNTIGLRTINLCHAPFQPNLDDRGRGAPP